VKRLLLIAAAAIAVWAITGTALAADGPKCPCLVVAKGPAFPVQTYVLTLPNGRTLTSHDVKVTENGQPVLDPSVVPAREATKATFGTVLVLDTSFSMNGKPLIAAVNAEKTFASHLNSNEQLGAVDFWNSNKVVLPLTTSATKISTALSSVPPVHGGTHIFDAVAQAEQMLTSAHISSGSIVVLSDGADRHSAKSLHEVAQAARADHIRIYTVGLQGPTFRPRTLKALAAAGRGTYAPAKSTQDLQPIFDALGTQISNQYLLQYKSLAGPNKPIRVVVDVNGVGTAHSGYRTPKLTVSTKVPPPYNPSIGDRVWSSPITMIVLALLGAAVIAFLTIGILQPRRSGLPARMAEFVSIRGLQRDKGEAATAAPVSEEAVTEQPNFWTRFEETLEIADIKAEPEMIIAGTFALTVLTFLLIYAGTGSYWWALFALGVPYLVREWVIRTLARRRNRFAEQLPDALQVIASALRSGHSLAGALAVVVESATEPMKSEMQQVVAEEQLGIPMEKSLLVVADRMANRDVEQLALVSELQREAGGNAAEVVDRVAETVRERFDLKRLIQTLTMQGRMSRWIVSALPIGIILALKVENPHYLHPLVASTAGKVVFGLAAAWAVAGSYAIKKIVEIEV
jgi:tight adherence protein B